MSPPTDLSSLSNFSLIRTTHIHLSWSIDWATQSIYGSAELTLEPVGEGVEEVVLDTSYLDVKGVEVDGEVVKWSLAERIPAMGSALTIHPKSPISKPVKVLITYSTTPECTALGWLTPEQTKGGKHPYLYSQSQAIHARSLLPCQDTPFIKSPYSSSIRSTLPVLMSALRVSPAVVDGVEGLGEGVGKEVVEYRYNQPLGVPAYLIAIAAGNLIHRSFPDIPGKDWHTGVWTEPEMMEASYYEFSADTAKFVATAESLTSPYPWGQYDLLLLPSSFPYGGMENTCLSFMTPSLLAGDRSLVNVCAHEISHSWFGNSIGCANWASFALNEGWTTYLENLLIGEMEGEDARDLAFVIGRTGLVEDLKLLPGKYQSLIPRYEKYDDPDEAFSQVPYEKGANLLLRIERQVGGLSVFKPYMQAYVREFAGQSITVEQWRGHLYEYFGGLKGGREMVGRLDELDWDGWLHGEGPDLCEDMQYGQTLSKQCISLASHFPPTAPPFSPSPSDISSFTPTQLLVLLERLVELPPLSSKVVQEIGEVYGFRGSGNAEVRLRFYMLAFRTGGAGCVEEAAEWVVGYGRMKFCRPIFRELYKLKPEFARKTFLDHEAFYHPIARKAIRKDMGLD